MALPDPMPNSEVKRRSADGSVGFPHVRVGHRRVYYYDTPIGDGWGVLFLWEIVSQDMLTLILVFTLSYVVKMFIMLKIIVCCHIYDLTSNRLNSCV